MDRPTNGMSDLWDVGLMGCRTYGMSDLWDVGLMGCRTYGMSDLWDVGLVAWPRILRHDIKSLVICHADILTDEDISFNSQQFNREFDKVKQNEIIIRYCYCIKTSDLKRRRVNKEEQHRSWETSGQYTIATK